MTTLTRTKVTFEHILIPTDFSETSDRAIEYAKSIAKQWNSQLLLVHVNPPFNPVTPPEAAWIDQDALIQRIEEQLEQSGAALRSEGFRAKAISVTGPLEDEILSFVKREGVDLIVLGTHGKKGLERLMLGSDAETVLRHVSCPVLTVGPAASDPPERVWSPKKVVCATTLEPASAWAAAYAYLFADQFNAQCLFLHVHPGKSQHLDDWKSFEHTLSQHLPADIRLDSTLHILPTDHATGSKIVDFAKRQAADLDHDGSAHRLPSWRLTLRKELRAAYLPKRHVRL